MCFRIKGVIDGATFVVFYNFNDALVAELLSSEAVEEEVGDEVHYLLDTLVHAQERSDIAECIARLSIFHPVMLEEIVDDVETCIVIELDLVASVGCGGPI